MLKICNKLQINKQKPIVNWKSSKLATVDSKDKTKPCRNN